MSLATIRDQVKAVVLTVAAVGVVNTFEPHATREEDFRRFFRSPQLGYVLGWSITRESTEEETHSTEHNLSHHLLVLRGYRALDIGGETETAFQDLIEAVRTALRVEQRDQLLLVGAPQAIFVGPPSVRIVEPRMFSDLLVHYCEITLRCSEFVPIVEAA